MAVWKDYTVTSLQVFGATRHYSQAVFPDWNKISIYKYYSCVNNSKLLSSVSLNRVIMLPINLKHRKFVLKYPWLGIENKRGTTKGITFTISILSIRQERRYCDNALLPYAHSQQTLVHARNQPSNPHIGIVSSHPIMAKHEKERKKSHPNVRPAQERTILTFKSTYSAQCSSQLTSPNVSVLHLPRAGWEVFQSA